MIGNFVIVRTFSAGVHTGFLVSMDGRQVELREARRIWRWSGANTLNEVSLRGCNNSYTRISEAVERIILTEAIEVICCTPEAENNLRGSRWGK